MSRFSKDFQRRAARVRFKLRSNSDDSLRVSVFRSERNLAVQLVDDDLHSTVCAISTLSKEVKSEITRGDNKDSAYKLGKIMAKKIKDLNLTRNLYFDRGGYAYHGRVKALADGMRDGGVKI